MEERRVLMPEDFETIVDTSEVAVTSRERDYVDGLIRKGQLIIGERCVDFHDPQIRTFSKHDTYRVNLDVGFIQFKDPEGNNLQTAPINLGPLSYLRELSGWEAPTKTISVK